MNGKAEKTRFSTFLVGCSEVYPRTVVGEIALRIWWEALCAYPIEAVESAFIRHMKSPDVGQYMPKPADIIRMIEGTSVDTSMVAWAKLDRAVRSVGPYSSVCFDDPIINRCIEEMGGWIALCAKREDEWPFVGNEFRTRHKSYRSRGELPEYPRRLQGITEAENSRRGIASEAEVAFVGDAEKARVVSLGGRDGAALGIQRVALEGAKALQLLGVENG